MYYLCWKDIDECRSTEICTPTSDCVNTMGSYKCTCKTGYVGQVTQFDNKDPPLLTNFDTPPPREPEEPIPFDQGEGLGSGIISGCEGELILLEWFCTWVELFSLFSMFGQQKILALFIYQLKSKKSNVTAHAWLCTWSFSRSIFTWKDNGNPVEMIKLSKMSADAEGGSETIIIFLIGFLFVCLRTQMLTNVIRALIIAMSWHGAQIPRAHSNVFVGLATVAWGQFPIAMVSGLFS